MPFIAIVHLRELQCPECGLSIAEAGARSFVVGTDGAPVWFADADMPSELAVDVSCENGHPARLLLPNEVGAEEAANVPEGAPFAPDAVLEKGFAESYKVL
ncbi:MAG: hypothetical protein ABI431_07595 [Candidatus Tumulicola sp.]